MDFRTQPLTGARAGMAVSAPPPDSQALHKSLNAAAGYAALGMYVDAWHELEQLPAELRATEEALSARIEILQRFGKWKFARQLAEALAKNFPTNPRWWLAWSISLRQEGSIHNARSILEEAAGIHPSVALIHYNLACYACVLGEMDASHGFLQRAFGLDERLKDAALNDPDLSGLTGSRAGSAICWRPVDPSA